MNKFEKITDYYDVLAKKFEAFAVIAVTNQGLDFDLSLLEKSDKPNEHYKNHNVQALFHTYIMGYIQCKRDIEDQK